MLKRLFRWLLSGFQSNSDETLDVYMPRRRILYRYSDGAKETIIDPMILYKKLSDISETLFALIKDSLADTSTAGESHEKAVALLRDVFQVKTYAAGGLTDMETFDLFSHFRNFCRQLQDRSGVTPTATMQEAAKPASAPAPPSAFVSTNPTTEQNASSDDSEKPTAQELPYASPGVPLVLLNGQEPPPNKMPVIYKVGDRIPNKT